MTQKIPVLPKGFAELISGELMTDSGEELLTDSYVVIVTNSEEESRYTNPDLHRRIENDFNIPPKSTYEYGLVPYDADGNPYPQKSKVGILDSMHSFRVIEYQVHDEESTTCEIP